LSLDPVRTGSASSRSKSTWRAAFHVAHKELVEGLRDRQTVLYTFLLPIALYPVLFLVMVQGALLVRGQKDATNVHVLLHAEGAERDTLVEALTRADHTAPDSAQSAEPMEATESSQGPTTNERSPVGRLDVDLLPESELHALDGFGSDAAVAWRPLATRLFAADDELGALVVVPGTRSAEAPIVAYHDSTRSRSTIALARLEERLEEHAEATRESVAEARAVDVAALEPIEVRTRDLATSAEEGALALSLMLPMLLIIMAVMGSFFPAVDLTAGEKERRTAETTLLLPIPRTAVHLGKILAVTAAGMVATSLNLVALALAAGHLLSQIGADIEVQLPYGALLAIAPLALLFVFFVSAVLTGIAGLAASFKEGQALLGPVQLIFIFPAMAASLPGLELGYGTALIPVVNVALAFRELLVGHTDLGPVLLTGAALFVYALLALRVSVRILSREGVALAGQTIPLKRLLGLLKGDGDTR
jgi:sodium transport system permease protein